MLTPNALARATSGFRAGYTHAIQELPFNDTTGLSVWWKQDYADGYKAGQNDLKWSRK